MMMISGLLEKLVTTLTNVGATGPNFHIKYTMKQSNHNLKDDQFSLFNFHQVDIQEFKYKLDSGEEELVPAEFAQRLIRGENAILVWREYRNISQKKLAKTVNFVVIGKEGEQEKEAEGAAPKKEKAKKAAKKKVKAKKKSKKEAADG